MSNYYSARCPVCGHPVSVMGQYFTINDGVIWLNGYCPNDDSPVARPLNW